VEWVDYKNVALLRRNTSDRGKIRARRVTGNCARHQHEVAMAIRTARELMLLPYACAIDSGAAVASSPVLPTAGAPGGGR
jgi:ribosomal protein S18